jgi:hypothetical protein
VRASRPGEDLDGAVGIPGLRRLDRAAIPVAQLTLAKASAEIS